MFVRMFDPRKLAQEGPTCVAGLMRIGIALLVWANWLVEFHPGKNFGPGYFVIGCCLYVFSTLTLIGLWSRLSAAGLAATMLTILFYLGYHRNMFYLTHHHDYLLVVMTCLLALMPCDRSLSLDKWLRLRRSGQEPAPDRGPLWALKLMAFQISMVYFWSAVGKTNAYFLSGGTLDYHFTGGRYMSYIFPLAPEFDGVRVFMSVATVILEYVLAFGLWIPRFRAVLMLIGMLFHAALYYAFPVSIFSLAMVLAYLSFLDPRKVHETVNRLLN